MALQSFYFTPSPKACDGCHEEFRADVGAVMYDANVGRQWGCLCEDCFKKLGCSLGMGRGQRYEREQDGKFWHREGLGD